jgi:hypothetical protein
MIENVGETRLPDNADHDSPGRLEPSGFLEMPRGALA